MKVIVSQYGSRHRYLIPQILESHGILAALYTDSTSDSKLGKFAKFICKYIKGLSSLQRLTRRRPGIPNNKVFTNDWLQIKILMNKVFKRPLFNAIETVFEGSSKIFIRQCAIDADWLYTMFIENYDFTLHAKQKGVKVLADIYENPYIWEELESEIENKAYASINYLKELYSAQAKLRNKYIDKLLETADQYLVPSLYVKECLERSPFYSENKVNIIPYPSSVTNKEYSNTPIIGRIVWIGNDSVRKGIRFCAETATILKKLGYEIDFRIIGIIPHELKSDPYFKDLNFIGYCNKEQLEQEFILADMFVFPTLAEGFAGVLLEAASFGVPIITTNASGFSEDAPCVFVEKKDTSAIVNAVINLITNREVRNNLSHKIFEYSQSFDSANFEESVINLLETK